MSQEVTYSQPFSAKIVLENGQKKLVVKNPRYYQHQINRKFKVGEDVILQVTNKRPKRTQAQNAYYWGVYLPLIAQETGESDVDRLHELFKGKFLTTGVVEVLGEKVRMKRSTAELSTSEFSEYILAIANLTNVEPPPTQNYDLEKLYPDEKE